MAKINELAEKRLETSEETIGLKRRFVVILSKPQNPENLGLVARSMKNLGFKNLRLIKQGSIEQKAYRVAVHSQEILDGAKLYSDLAQAISDLHVVFAATSKERKNFSRLTLNEALEKMFSFPPATKIGLLFGNEKTGLTSEELKFSNFRFFIPQATRQPSYNLASSVLITLFQIFIYKAEQEVAQREIPLSREQQDGCTHLILEKLEEKKFIHRTNKTHVTEMICDLLGRLTLTAKDKKFLLALFSKGVNEKMMRES